jgi:hypothetical protein
MKRRAKLFVTTLAATITVGGVAPVLARADVPTCPDGNSCFWTSLDYTGERAVKGGEFGGTGWHHFDNSNKYSVKNRYSNRAVYIHGTHDQCLNPGQEDPATFPVWDFKVTVQGRRC